MVPSITLEPQSNTSNPKVFKTPKQRPFRGIKLPKHQDTKLRENSPINLEWVACVYLICCAVQIFCLQNFHIFEFTRTFLPSSAKTTTWPPLKIYVYPKNDTHTDQCLYPASNPTQYTNEHGFWFQRMLEPVVYQQLLESPLVTHDPTTADLFYIPHYSRICSDRGDDNQRWKDIPQYIGRYGSYFTRYSYLDHVIIHSVPNYFDKPADSALIAVASPIIGILDFAYSNVANSAWTLSKNIQLPFITLVDNITHADLRTHCLFVAMATNKIRQHAANFRLELLSVIQHIDCANVYNISRGNVSQFQNLIDDLPKMMRDSDYCAIPPGDAPSSKRFFDAISHLCLPLLLSDNFILPFEDVPVDYSEFLVQIPQRKVAQVADFTRQVTSNATAARHSAVEKVKKLFTWDYKHAPREGEAFWLFTWALYDRHRLTQPYLNNEMTGFDDDPPTPFVDRPPYEYAHV